MVDSPDLKRAQHLLDKSRHMLERTNVALQRAAVDTSDLEDTVATLLSQIADLDGQIEQA